MLNLTLNSLKVNSMSLYKLKTEILDSIFKEEARTFNHDPYDWYDHDSDYPYQDYDYGDYDYNSVFELKKKLDWLMEIGRPTLLKDYFPKQVK